MNVCFINSLSPVCKVDELYYIISTVHILIRMIRQEWLFIFNISSAHRI